MTGVGTPSSLLRRARDVGVKAVVKCGPSHAPRPPSASMWYEIQRFSTSEPTAARLNSYELARGFQLANAWENRDRLNVASFVNQSSTVAREMHSTPLSSHR